MAGACWQGIGRKERPGLVGFNVGKLASFHPLALFLFHLKEAMRAKTGSLETCRRRHV